MFNVLRIQSKYTEKTISKFMHCMYDCMYVFICIYKYVYNNTQFVYSTDFSIMQIMCFKIK